MKRTMTIKTMGFRSLLLATIACAGLTAGAGDRGQLSVAAQSAVVTAVALVEGYAFSNQYVLVQCQEGTADTYRVSISVKTGNNLPEIHTTNSPAMLLAVVESTRREGTKVFYQNKRLPPSGNEPACRAAVAYRAQQGWLPAGFWMTCDLYKDARSIFFWTKPNRWPGDHCTVVISDSGIRVIGGL